MFTAGVLVVLTFPPRSGMLRVGRGLAIPSRMIMLPSGGRERPALLLSPPALSTGIPLASQLVASAQSPLVAPVKAADHYCETCYEMRGEWGVI